MRGGEAGDVARHPQPQPLHFDRLAFIDHIVVDAGAAGLGEKRAQARVAGRGGGEGRRRAGRRARHADPTVRPVLRRDPVERVIPVRRVVGIDPVLALGAVTAAAVLINRGIAVRHDSPPAAQDRTAHRFGRVRQPGMQDVELVACIGRRDPVRRAVQDGRKARPVRRQKDECVETDAVAHRHHSLCAARAARGVGDPIHASSRAMERRSRGSAGTHRGACHISWGILALSLPSLRRRFSCFFRDRDRLTRRSYDPSKAQP